MRSPSNRPAETTERPRRGMRRFLEQLIFGREDQTDPKRGRLMLESLEQRQLMAGDLELLFTDGTPDTSDQAAQTGGLQAEGQGEGELAPDLVQFAKDLVDAGVQFFGAEWCSACTTQKELFQDGKDNLGVIEVTNPDRTLNSIGLAEGIEQFPTWDFPDGTRLTGIQTLETLSNVSGVAIPQSEMPTFETIGDLTVAIGSPVHIPIDAYDPDSDELTVTVTVEDPNLLEAVVISGNRSIRIDMEGYGDMVFELFEGRAPTASGRVADLAEAGFYDGIIFHRVVDDFVIQGGDPTGTGTSGSNLGTFDDDFHPELQHNREAVLSFAKSSDDTNNSQFFVTETPTRFLDFNHSIFGQLVEGFDVREAISETAVGAGDRPINDVIIDTIEVFEDNENSVVMLKPTGNATGTTNVTFTVTDGDGNTFSETVSVSVTQDTANSQPFLNDIAAPPTTPINTAAQLQLSSVDVEGDAVQYFAQSLSGNATVNIDSTTGLLTVTPVNNFAGSVDVSVGVSFAPGVTGNSSSDVDTQTVSFTFEGELIPITIDLLSGSDSGASNSDNVTNEGSLSFEVSGVTDGATVDIINRDNNAIVGTGVASGSTVAITTSNIAALGDGTYSLSARQTVGNQTGELSTPLTLVYDTTSPDSVADTAATQGNVEREYLSDLASSEEGSGLVYQLLTAPNGATIDPTTGVINWTPTDAQLGDNTFTLELTDVAGNVRNENFTVDVAAAPIAEVRLEVTDLQGNPISSIEVGQKFLLNFIAVDLREFSFDRDGVFGAFADILFDNNLVRPEPGSAIIYDSQFGAVQKGTFSNGLIDELGAVATSTVATNTDVNLVATVRMEALASGTVNIRSEPADDVNSEFLLYGLDDQVPASSVAYGSVSLAIGQSFTVVDDQLSVAEDSGDNVLDVLANDNVVSGNGTLTVVSATQPAEGGTVSVNDGVLTFRPDDDFNGESIFTYRVSDNNGVQENATVTVTVTPVNDPPVGNEDTLTVDENSTENVLDVLANDEIAPDTGETLTITAVGTTTDGGTLDITVGGGSLIYTPATDFVGTETFTYTVSDGDLEEVVTVNVVVAPTDAPPTANDDTFTIAEDTPETEFDVLGNDTRDGDNQQFVLDAVGVPSVGGSARISNDGTQFFYTPAADFNGTETVTYTIRDTGGGVAVGTVTFTVTAENDAPPVDDLTANISRASGENQVFELSDLPDNVDFGESLTISAPQTSGQGGTVAVDPNTQAILYTAPSSDFVGTDTITYTVADGTDETSTGTITVIVNDYTRRSVLLAFDGSSQMPMLDGIMLKGTNLLGDTVEVPIEYNGERASFDDLFPGSYVIEIPANPFLQNAEVARQIPVESTADAGDMTVESGLGRLRAKFVSIRDWLGSAPAESIFAAVAPGSQSAFAVASQASTLTAPVIELDSDGTNLSVRGRQVGSDGSESNVEATLPAVNDSRVETRAEIDGVRLLKINVDEDDVNFSPVPAAEGEQVPASSQLTVGDFQAEGESIAAGGVTQADLFVPVTDDGSTRSDATVLATEEADLWVGENLVGQVSSDGVGGSNSVDDAMQNVAEELTIVESAGDEIAETSQGMDENAVDAVLGGNL